jgi:hypothetical protein
MEEILSEEDFAKHVHTKFRVRVDGPVEVDLELESVVGYQGGEKEQAGLARFSLFFDGPPNFLIAQGLVTLDHEQLGEVVIFLVPIGRNEGGGFRYESVSNYYKDKE